MEPLDTVISIRISHSYERELIHAFNSLEAGPNTSTVTLRIVGGGENGSLKSETVKYGLESHGTRTRE
jgi:hypothetical protein